MKNIKNILLINFGGIGDEILFSPVLTRLKNIYPDCKITLCLESRSKAFLSLTDCIDNAIFADIKTKNKYFEMFRLWLKALFGSFDTVISAGGSPLISLLLFFTGIKTRIGYKTGKLSEILLTDAVNLNKEQYASAMYYDLLSPITDLPFILPEIKTESVEKKENSVVVHPGVSAISIKKNIQKTVDGNVWAEIVEKLIQKGKNVYLAGGPDDRQCIETIRNTLKAKNITNYIDMYGKTKNIYDLALLIKSCETLVCSDSAPMHIGVATGTKTVAIFGPTDEKKLLPISDLFIPVTNDSSCRPCLWNKRLTTCEKVNCLKINVQKIIDAVGGD